MLRRILCRLGWHRYDHHEVRLLGHWIQVIDTCDCGKVQVCEILVGEHG